MWRFGGQQIRGNDQSCSVWVYYLFGAMFLLTRARCRQHCARRWILCIIYVTRVSIHSVWLNFNAARRTVWHLITPSHTRLDLQYSIAQRNLTHIWLTLLSIFFFALLRKLFSKTSTIFPYYNPGQEALDSITSLRVQNVIRACRTHSNLCLTGCVGWSVCFLLGQSPAHLAFTAILNTDQFFATSQRLSRWHFNLLVNLQANAALHYDMHLSFLILLLLKPSFCSGSKS